MIQEMVSLYDANKIAAAFVTLILLIKYLPKLGGLIEFRDKHFVEKRYKRLRKLRSQSSDNGDFSQYLDDTIELEAFQIASGIRANAKQADALMKISRTGLWNRAQLKRLSQYLVVSAEHPTPSIRIDNVDVVTSYFSLIIGLCFVLLGGTCTISAILTMSWPGMLIGLVVQLALTCLGAFIAIDYRTYRCAVVMKQYLIENPNVLDSDTKAAHTATTRSPS